LLAFKRRLVLVVDHTSRWIRVAAGKGNGMTRKHVMDKLAVYIPKNKVSEQPVERLVKLGEKHDRSVNYLVVEAILEYLEKEEA